MTTQITVKNLLTEEEICQKYRVTPEEIDKATRILNTTTGEVWYQVDSRSGGEAHEVRYNTQFGRLTCTCKAGRVGVPCWAKRAAAASAFIYRQEQRIAAAKEQAEQEAALIAKRAYESDRNWQQQERAAAARERRNSAQLGRGPEEQKFIEMNGHSVPMR